MNRFLATLLALIALAWPGAASADVLMSFHSFSGSLFSGRYSHTFIVLEGTLDATGERVSENYGFTAKEVSRAVLQGPVEHAIQVEPAKYIKSTKRHFTVKLSDAQYRRVRAEVERWRTAPGKYYDLDRRNCLHFVGAMAEIVGIKVVYPQSMLRKPRQWLDHLGKLNPWLAPPRKRR
ncbi:MAG: hypothetical protein B7X57_09710 [Erythrobacter sp. 34-65-8]|nr:MAG: hypothetical protein B7X57_09710 [Erythrobacter sp. 34-65-8]